MRTHSLDEKAQLSSGWISVESELSSLNFDSSVRAEQSFVIRYPNVVIKSLCGNLDICLNFQSRNSVGMLSVMVCDWKHANRITRPKDTFLNHAFRSRSLNSSAEMDSGHEKPSTRMHLFNEGGPSFSMFRLPWFDFLTTFAHQWYVGVVDPFYYL